MRHRNFSPKSVASANCIGWWQAEPAYLTLSGSSVTTWFDISGGSTDISQATPSRQPAFEASAFNGRPSVFFTMASSQYLININVNNITKNIKGNDIPWSAYIMWETTSGSGQDLFSFGNSASTIQVQDYFINTTTLNSNRRGDDNILHGAGTNPGAITTNTRYVNRIFYSGTAMSIRVNNTQVLTNFGQDAGVISTLDQFAMGSAILGVSQFNPFNGRIAELIIYSQQPSVTDDLVISEYLQNRYQISNS